MRRLRHRLGSLLSISRDPRSLQLKEGKTAVAKKRRIGCHGVP